MSADFSLWKTRINVWKKDKLSLFPLFVRFILSFPLTNCLVYGYEVSSRVIPTINPGLLFSFVEFVKLKVHDYLFLVIFLKLFQVFRDMFQLNKEWWVGQFHIPEFQECKESFFKCQLIFSLKFPPCVKTWINVCSGVKSSFFTLSVRFILGFPFSS